MSIRIWSHATETDCGGAAEGKCLYIEIGCFVLELAIAWRRPR